MILEIRKEKPTKRNGLRSPWNISEFVYNNGVAETKMYTKSRIGNMAMQMWDFE
jgi:hypothetical protein